MNTLKSYLILVNNSRSKGLEYYFEAPSISHLKNVLGSDSKDPWKESKVNSILYINDPMPRFESQKANKSQESPEKAICIKTKY